jgi:hypothetical protein
MTPKQIFDKNYKLRMKFDSKSNLGFIKKNLNLKSFLSFENAILYKNKFPKNLTKTTSEIQWVRPMGNTRAFRKSVAHWSHCCPLVSLVRFF